MDVRNTVFSVFLALTSALALPIQTNAQQQQTPVMVSKVNLVATVQNVDRDNRIVTLKGPKGNVVDMKIGEQVAGFDQIQKGDKVELQYVQSLALSLSNKPTPPAEFSQFVEMQPEGEAPATVRAATLQVPATIEKIDKKKREVTVKGPQGKTVVLSAGPDMNLDAIKKGDQVIATYTEAVAVELKKASS